MLKTPKFWLKRTAISYALLPFSAIYYAIFLLRKKFSNPQKIAKPVICVGNIIAGGSGKTPTAMALGKILQDLEVNFAFLSRGYMNDGTKFLMLRSEDKLDAKKVGDEPIILSKMAPTFVAKNRLFGARQIEKMTNFQAIILDDGAQNVHLKPDYIILVIDAKVVFGNGFLIPAGPLRETIRSGISKANLVVVVNDDSSNLIKNLKKSPILEFAKKKIIGAQIIAKNSEEFSNKNLLAFCGLAYPEKFFKFLKENNLKVEQELGFADHYSYKNSDLEKILEICSNKKLTPITTKKDWVKFDKKFQNKISYLDVEMHFDDVDLVRNEMKKILSV